MKTLVFGQTGQVARELAGTKPPDVTAHFLNREQADLAVAGTIGAAIDQYRPDVVINAAAYTAVDRAEGDAAFAMTINGQAPGVMAWACAGLGIPFLHVSTDYVFDGAGDRPWRETDPAAPLNVYGQSKLAGEQAIRDAGGNFAILRTSWVFSAYGGNFVKTMLSLAKSRPALDIVGDQVGGPTPARDIALALWHMAGELQADGSDRRAGIYHYSGSPDTSWADFARAIFEASRNDVPVTDIPTSAYPTAARRPLNTRLDCSRIHRAFGLPRPDWKAGLVSVLKQLEET